MVPTDITSRVRYQYRTNERREVVYRNVEFHRRGLLFHSVQDTCESSSLASFVLARERKIWEFFPRLFKVNKHVTRRMLFDHFQHPQWLHVKFGDTQIFHILLDCVEISFINNVGWKYLEYCEEKLGNKKHKLPLKHFVWWCENVNMIEEKCCGR